MGAYIILVFLVVLCVIVQENTHKTALKYNKVKMSISILVMFTSFFLFYALRYNVGMDYMAYYNMTVNANGYMIPLIRGEWLSALFVWFAYTISCPYFYFGSIAFISFAMIMYAINKYVEVENGLGWGLLAFMVMPIGFTASLSMMRQFVAISIILYSAKYIIKRSVGKFCFCVFVASSFHMASIVSMFMYVVTSKSFKYKYFALFFLMFIVCFFVLNNYIGMIFPGFNQYLNTSYTADNGGLQMGSVFQLLLYVFLAICFILLKKYLAKYKNFDVFLRCYLLGVVCSGALFFVEPYNAFRAGAPMLYFWLLIMPYFFYAFKKKSAFIMKVCMWCFLLTLVCYNLISMEMKGHLLEYQIFFDI